MMRFLGRKVHPEPTHLYLNFGSHHRPSNTHAVPSILVHTTRPHQDILYDELESLNLTFRQHCYSDGQICRALDPPVRVA
jgi:hypothetical protein